MGGGGTPNQKMSAGTGDLWASAKQSKDPEVWLSGGKLLLELFTKLIRKLERSLSFLLQMFLQHPHSARICMDRAAAHFKLQTFQTDGLDGALGPTEKDDLTPDSSFRRFPRIHASPRSTPLNRHCPNLNWYQIVKIPGLFSQQTHKKDDTVVQHPPTSQRIHTFIDTQKTFTQTQL